MFLSSNFVYVVGEEVLCDQGDAHVRSYSEVECWESNPKLSYAFVGNCLAHGIEDILVGELSIGICLHLLDLSLRIIKRQTDK